MLLLPLLTSTILLAHPAEPNQRQLFDERIHQLRLVMVRIPRVRTGRCRSLLLLLLLLGVVLLLLLALVLLLLLLRSLLGGQLCRLGLLLDEFTTVTGSGAGVDRVN